jgi:hypothetical protein
LLAANPTTSQTRAFSSAQSSSGAALRDPLPEGYSVVPKDALESVNGGLRVGQPGILANEAGCWHARIRNPSRRQYGGERWLWHADIDPRAPIRYRSRAWRSATGTEVPSGCQLGTSCGDPACFNPHHLTVSARPVVAPQAPTVGRWEWFVEEDEETGEEVEVCEWVAGAAPMSSEANDYSRILIRPKRERPRAASQRAHWEATRDWQAIDAEADGLSQEAIWAIRTQCRSFAEFSARWNVSVDVVRAARYGRYGDGARVAPKPKAEQRRPQTFEPAPRPETPTQSAPKNNAVQALSCKLAKEGLWALRKGSRPATLPPSAAAPATPQAAQPTAQPRVQREDAPPGPGKGRGRHARGAAAGSAKITDEDVRAIRASSDGLKALGRRYGMSPQAIHKIRTGRSWAHVT